MERSLPSYCTAAGSPGRHAPRAWSPSARSRAVQVEGGSPALRPPGSPTGGGGSAGSMRRTGVGMRAGCRGRRGRSPPMARRCPDDRRRWPTEGRRSGPRLRTKGDMEYGWKWHRAAPSQASPGRRVRRHHDLHRDHDPGVRRHRRPGGRGDPLALDQPPLAHHRRRGGVRRRGGDRAHTRQRSRDRGGGADRGRRQRLRRIVGRSDLHRMEADQRPRPRAIRAPSR